MGRTIELADVHDVALIFEHSCFVIVDVEVVGSGEDGHNRWEACRFGLAIHAIPRCINVRIRLAFRGEYENVPSILSLMRPDDGKQVVPLEELTRSLIAGGDNNNQHRSIGS